jgi:hypothetical protein
MPSRYEPPAYVESKAVTTLNEANANLRQQVQRRNDVREQIKSMDSYETRSEIVDLATESLRISRENYLTDNYEEGHVAGQIADVALDLATSLTPGVGWARDIYEAISGKDLHSGEILGTFSRSMAVLGAATLGFGSKAGRAISVFEKLAKATGPFADARKLLYSKPLSELKETVGYFKKYKFWTQTDESAVLFSNAFMKNAKRTVLTEDRIAYRYYNPAKTNPRGNWLTFTKLDNHVEDLALPHSSGYVAYKWIIPKGTEILEGFAAPNFARKGGAHQIVVGDISVLKEIL